MAVVRICAADGVTMHDTYQSYALRVPLSQGPPVTCWRGVLKALASEDMGPDEFFSGAENVSVQPRTDYAFSLEDDEEE